MIWEVSHADWPRLWPQADPCNYPKDIKENVVSHCTVAARQVGIFPILSQTCPGHQCYETGRAAVLEMRNPKWSTTRLEWRDNGHATIIPHSVGERAGESLVVHQVDFHDAAHSPSSPLSSAASYLSSTRPGHIGQGRRSAQSTPSVKPE